MRQSSLGEVRGGRIERLTGMQLRHKTGVFQKGGCATKPAARGYWFFIHQLTDTGSSTKRSRQQPGELLSEVEKLRRLEAVLFLSPEGLSSRKLAKLAGLADATEARTLIRQLNLSLDEHGRAYRVEEIAGGYSMMTRSAFAPWLRRLSHVPGAVKLGQSALETLSVVAYRQPVMRANVEAIRGVGCSEVLKQLMELDLVRVCGRSEELGRPYLYGTTRRFLQMFGLRSADRLPRIEWVNEIHLSMSTKEIAELDSESKESTVKKSFTGTALLEENAIAVDDDSLLDERQLVTAAIDDDEDDFEDDEDVDDDEDDIDEFDDDDDEEWDDDEDDEDVDDDLEEEDAAWEEVDDEDDDDLDDDDEEDDDDLDDDDEDDDDDDWGDDDEDDDEDWD